VTTLSKFLHLGLPLEDVVAMATTAPAAALRRGGDFGTLAVGALADVAVLRLDHGSFMFTDSFGRSVTGSQRLAAVASLKAGRRVDRGG
jgi:dihydroorotase